MAIVRKATVTRRLQQKSIKVNAPGNILGLDLSTSVCYQSTTICLHALLSVCLLYVCLPTCTCASLSVWNAYVYSPPEKIKVYDHLYM